MRHTAQWWAERVEEFAQTCNARAVARRHGVKERTLVWWRSELRRRAREGTGPRLLPVVVRTVPPRVAAGHADELEVFVEVGATRMTMRGAVSAEHIAALVTASTRSC
jgi:transposase-like protein